MSEDGLSARVRTQERRRIVLELKARGLSNKQIELEMKKNHSELLPPKYTEIAVATDLTRGLEEVKNNLKETAQTVLVSEINRCEALWSSAFPLTQPNVIVNIVETDKDGEQRVKKVKTPVPIQERLQAVRACLAVQDRKASFLGLNAPSSVKIGGDEDNPIEVDLSPLRDKLQKAIENKIKDKIEQNPEQEIEEAEFEMVEEKGSERSKEDS
jgi:hypothetical protein